LRDELLNETLFASLAHARDDTNRPHSSIGNMVPADYTKLSAPTSQRDGTLRTIEGFAPRPVAAPSQA
jgi:putative transposase